MTQLKPLNCEEALRMLAEHLDGELDDAGHRDVDEHLRTCRSCFSRAEFERRLQEQIGALRHEPVATGFEAQIRGLISRFATVAPTRPSSE